MKLPPLAQHSDEDKICLIGMACRLWKASELIEDPLQKQVTQRAIEGNFIRS